MTAAAPAASHVPARSGPPAVVGKRKQKQYPAAVRAQWRRAYAARIRDELAEMRARQAQEHECAVLVYVPYQGLFVVGTAVLRQRAAAAGSEA